ncbi:MAG TPA: DUF1631 family protein [Burkholderiales bacterium]|nr:DUF1631 family protein [Burkholderiales bacterium]
MDTPKRSAAQTAVNRPVGAENKALLGQTRDLARSKLSRIVAEALDKVENDLFAAAEACTSRAEQQLLFETMTQVKKHRSEIATSFDRHFLEVFERRIATRRLSKEKTQELKLEDLKLVDDDAMEEDLVVSDLARKTRNRVDQDELLGIRARLGHLLSTEDLEDSGNPLSPEAVFEALRLSCAKIPGDFAIKRSLLNAFQPHVAAGITAVYADLNKNLIAHHVLPRINFHVKRARDVGVAQRPGDAAGGMGASQAMNLAQLWGNTQSAAGVGTSQLMQLGQLLNAAGVPGVAAAMSASQQLDLSTLLAGVVSGPPSGRQAMARVMSEPSQFQFERALEMPATPELMASLTRLQTNAGFVPTLGTNPSDFIGALDQQVRTQSHPLDQLTIELVTMVFDYVLDDREISETVKAELVRLQIVAIKAALLDRTFFARRAHPMRRFLDQVAEAASDPDVATDEQSKFLSGLRGIVDYLVHDFTDDLTVFTVALETLEKLIAEDAQRREKEIEPTTVELVRKEEAEIAHHTALAEIKRRATRKTPGFVREFLYHWWTKTLVDAYMKNREGDDSWTHRLGIVDALVWSVAPLRTAEIQQLASMLPTLMKSLLRGMNAIEMPPEARHAFFNQLMQAHTATINAAKAQAKTQTPGATDAAPAVAEVEPPDDPATGPVTNSGMDDDYWVHTAMALERGAVLEFDEGAATVRSKLSWVSPKQTILLFTASGSAARQLAPKILAGLLRDNKARIVEGAEALMDRVVTAMVGTAGDEALPAAA